MKILYVIDSLKYGGTERQLVELIKGIDNIFKSEYSIIVVCLVKDKDSYENELLSLGIPIFYFIRKFKFDLSPILKIVRLILINQIDIVHSYNNIGAIFGAIAAKLTCRPLICSAVRDGKDWNFFSKMSKNFLGLISDAYIANSISGFKNRFKRIKKNFYVIYNGINLKRFKKNMHYYDQLRMDLQLNNFKYCIGMVAALSKRKDHDTIIYAAFNIIKTMPEVCFIIVGDGERKKEVEKLTIKLGLDRNFKFLGYRDDCDRITRLLDIAVMLTNTKFHYEGISNSLIEAMASGVPVIATRGGGTNEIIDNNINGILVDPQNAKQVSDKILELLNDHNKYVKISTNAYKKIKHLCDLSNYVKQHLKIYRDTLNK